MIYHTVWVIISLTSFCLGTCEGEDTNTKLEEFQRSIKSNNALTTEKKNAVLDSLQAFKGSLQSRGVEVDLGSEAGNKHYKTEVQLLVECFKAGQPIDSGFGEWLKNDLDAQVAAHVAKLSKQTEKQEKEKQNINDVLLQLSYDLCNLGHAISPEKMLEHTNWLDNDFNGFTNRLQKPS